MMDRGTSRLELISGVLASLLCVGSVGPKLLFGIFGARVYIDPASGSTTANITSYPLQHFGVMAVLAVSLLLLAAIGVGIGSCYHSKRGGPEPLAFLCVCSGLLVVGAAFLMYSLGIVLLVGAVLSVVASLAAIRAHALRVAM